MVLVLKFDFPVSNFSNNIPIKKIKGLALGCFFFGSQKGHTEIKLYKGSFIWFSHSQVICQLHKVPRSINSKGYAERYLNQADILAPRAGNTK